jgi:hypothetical protein
MRKLAKIKVEGKLGWLEFNEDDGQWAFGTVEGTVLPLKYRGQEIDLAGSVGKKFVLHGSFYAGLLNAERLEAV